MANKKAATEAMRRSAATKQWDNKRKEQEFDIFTKAPGSPSKNARRFKGFVDPVSTQYSGKYN